MASTQDFINYIMEQLFLVGPIYYKKMFGDYGIFLEGKTIALVCDNQLFIKPTPEGQELLEDIILCPPYKGAKDWFLIENLEDREYLARIMLETYRVLPIPKPKKKKKD